MCGRTAMMKNYDRKRYEQLIMKSPLFSLNKEKEYTAFKKESYRMVEFLYCYLLSISEEYEPYGCEIAELASRCIKNYDSSKGIFLHYFNSAWKKEYKHIMGRENLNLKLRGLKVPEKTLKNPEQIKELSVYSNYYNTEEGSEENLWDLLPGLTPIDHEGKKLETQEGIEELLVKIEEAFSSLQERQKPLISDILTLKICESLINPDIERYTFLNQLIIDEWENFKKIPTQKEIAEKHGRKEASASRTFKGFLKKIKIDFD